MKAAMGSISAMVRKGSQVSRTLDVMKERGLDLAETMRLHKIDACFSTPQTIRTAQWSGNRLLHAEDIPPLDTSRPVQEQIVYQLKHLPMFEGTLNPLKEKTMCIDNQPTSPTAH